MYQIMDSKEIDVRRVLYILKIALCFKKEMINVLIVLQERDNGVTYPQVCLKRKKIYEHVLPACLIRKLVHYIFFN